ncbi:Transcription initiation factor TFIID subunit 2, partial [Mucuna pruriens]
FGQGIWRCVAKVGHTGTDDTDRALYRHRCLGVRDPSTLPIHTYTERKRERKKRYLDSNSILTLSPMAKPRKPKNNEDPKPENSGALVHHQKLCLSIDMDKRLVHGYTELEIAVPEIGIVGLHAENLGIESVWVDGEPTEFEYYPHHQQQSEDDKRFGSVCSPSSAADAAVSVYVSALEKELVPNLLINCCKPSKADSEQQQQQPVSENGFHSSAEPK